MFDRLDDLLIRYEELMGELQEPDVANDPERFRKLMKEQSDLAPIIEAYQEYKKCKQNIEDSLLLLEEESDEEMKELAKEELSESRKRVEELEQERLPYCDLKGAKPQDPKAELRENLWDKIISGCGLIDTV